MQWVADLAELEGDFALILVAHETLKPVETEARIAFHDRAQDAVKVLTPAPRFMAALMAGGFVKRKRQVGVSKTGWHVFDGSKELLPPMTHDEAVAFIAWRDLPAGTNHFRVIHSDDLPRIAGCIDKARSFRDAWRLDDIVDIHLPAARTLAKGQIETVAQAATARLHADFTMATLLGEDMAPLERRARHLRAAPNDARLSEAPSPAALHSAVTEITAAL